MSVPSHPLKPFALAIGLNRLYEARSFNIKPFSERAKAVLNDAHLNNINIQENNILAFPPWDIQIFNYHNPFSGYHKAGTADIIYQQLFSFHRSKYSKYVPVYTDGSKTAGHVGAELTAILVALQHIIVSYHRHFCVYTDSMSALESLHFSTEHRYPTVIEILLLLRKLERKGFDIIFSWVPGHVGILGNEQADTAARSMSDHMQRPVCYQDLKTSTQNYIHRVWQETWNQQVLNKLHSIYPSTSHWAALPVRRHDVRLSRPRIGHTRFTHRHLLLGENAPECPSLGWIPVVYSYYVKHRDSCDTDPTWSQLDISLPGLCALFFSNWILGVLFVLFSVKGTISDPQPRRHVVTLVYVKLFVSLLDVVWAILGTDILVRDCFCDIYGVILVIKVCTIFQWVTFLFRLVAIIGFYDWKFSKKNTKDGITKEYFTDPIRRGTFKKWHFRMQTLFLWCTTPTDARKEALKTLSELLALLSCVNKHI
ncbi:putative RNA-directed DNA polymerase from transposon X-element [Trichonephila clavipes]|nr:putative RNA-directed DNA polymerase from transposon X-element [Trichonephila clavipes]